MDAQIIFDKIADDLRGMELTHFWRGHGSAIFMEFGTLSPRRRLDGSLGNAQGEISLMIQWSWRIENSTSITCGSWSDEKLWEAIFKRLVGSKALGLTIFGRLPEVDLEVEKNQHVVSFSTTDGQPQWSLFDRRLKDVYLRNL